MRLKYNFELQPIAGMFVAVATGKGAENFSGVIRLNESGAKIFEFLQKGLSDEDVLSEMLKIYEANPEDVKEDICKVKQILEANNLIA